MKIVLNFTLAWQTRAHKTLHISSGWRDGKMILTQLNHDQLSFLRFKRPANHKVFTLTWSNCQQPWGYECIQHTPPKVAWTCKLSDSRPNKTVAATIVLRNFRPWRGSAITQSPRTKWPLSLCRHRAPSRCSSFVAKLIVHSHIHLDRWDVSGPNSTTSSIAPRSTRLCSRPPYSFVTWSLLLNACCASCRSPILRFLFLMIFFDLIRRCIPSATPSCSRRRHRYIFLL